MAAQHHAAMTGHSMTGAKTVMGALAGDADRQQEADQADLDRQHQAATTDATLGNQVKIAKMRPKPGPRR
jgi:hypothetical protein